MPRNGSGSYSLPNNTFYPGVNGVTIQTADANTTMADIQSALSGSVAADGQTPLTGDLNLGGNQLTSVGAPAALTDAATASDIQTARLTYLTGAAGTNTITASVPFLAALAAGESFQFIAAATNTAAVTLNINSIGAKAITRFGATALVAGDITISSAVTVMYDGTQFQLLNPAKTNFQTGGGAISGPAYTTPVSVAFSATPTFNTALSNVFRFGALTANVTNVTLSNPSDGQTINIRFVQDGTGGRTVTLPATIKAAGAVETAASRVSLLMLTYLSASTVWEGAWVVVPA